MQKVFVDPEFSSSLFTNKGASVWLLFHRGKRLGRPERSVFDLGCEQTMGSRAPMTRGLCGVKTTTDTAFGHRMT